MHYTKNKKKQPYLSTSKKNDENINKNYKFEEKNSNHLINTNNLPRIQNNNINNISKDSYCQSSNKNKTYFNPKYTSTSLYEKKKDNTCKDNLKIDPFKKEYKIKKGNKFTEHIPCLKSNEKINLKIDYNDLNQRIENLETQLLQFSKKTSIDINEIKKNNSKIENSIKSNLIEFNNNTDIKLKNINDNIKALSKKIQENVNTFEVYKINNKSLTEKIENTYKIIEFEIKALKKQNLDENKIKSQYKDFLLLNEKNKNEFIELKNQKELFKKELEKLNLKFNEFEKNNKELNDKIEEYHKQNIELKSLNKEYINQNEELKNHNNEIKKLNEILTKQNDKIIKQNEKLKNENDELKKEIKRQNEELKKLNDEIMKQKEAIKEQIEKLKINDIKKNRQNKESKNQNIETFGAEKDKTKKKYYEKKYALIGLSNIGNNCYMNAVLQVLKNIPQFTYNIIKLNDEGDNFLIQLKNLFINLCRDDNSIFSPKEFKKYLGFEKLGKIFAGNNQYDSSIFFVSLLNIIDKKLNNEKIKKIDLSKIIDKTLEEKQIIYKKNDYSYLKKKFIYDTFYIYFVNEIKCKACKDAIHIFQKTNYLDFPIVTVNGNVKSLGECFDNYQKIKEVKDTCSKCSCSYKTHQYILLELPPVLIINLKRVGEQLVYFNEIEIPQKLEIGKVVKLSKNISNSTYELRGFIKHDGNEKSGHNYAFCKNMFDNQWYEYNDELCREINGELDLNKIFFLCYMREGFNNDNIDYIEEIAKLLNN